MRNPFRGLLPFEEEHAALFFGRDREIREIATRLEHRRLLAITGVSGSGKSSLIRAGVIPMLKAGLIPKLGTRLRVAVMKPRGGPLAELRKKLAMALGREVDPETLTRTTYGLVDGVKPLAPEESLLVWWTSSKRSFNIARTIWLRTVVQKPSALSPCCCARWSKPTFLGPVRRPKEDHKTSCLVIFPDE